MQALQGLFHALLPVPAIEQFDAGLQRVEVFAGFMSLEAIAQRTCFGHALTDHVEHRRVGGKIGFLRHIDPPQALLHLHQSIVRRLQPGKDAQQRRFTCAVAPDQTDALARLQRHRGMIEQGHMAERQ
ncbi:hypothetical protein GALL_411600 [mine drainage metagenome]|uniref:Uncharacterized protein n=1 Tax=mine drainage metagenome TaxID=410659 RepID=A0A1J5Q1E7_9ZZZZ